MVKFCSDCVEEVCFESETEQREFDELINSKEYYLEVAKENLKEYFENTVDSASASLQNGELVFEIPVYDTLAEYVHEQVGCGLEDAYFNELGEYVDEDEDSEFEVISYVESKVEEFADEINKLAEDVLAATKFKIVR